MSGSTSGNKATAHKFMEQIIGTGDWSAADDVMSENATMNHPSSPEPVRGRDAIMGFLTMFRAGFPDLNMTVNHAVEGEDHVVVRWTMTGTHTEDLFGIPPTNKPVKVTGISMFRFENGVIVEDTVEEDAAGMLRQIGLIPG
ncbi:MAG: ester cyclase [Chloroflexia bacterium]